MIRILISFILVVFCSVKVSSQVGIGTSMPNDDAALELNIANKGFLVSRVSLIDTANPAPLTSHVEGMIVFNTNSGATLNVSPGLYYNTGVRWEKLVAESTAAKKMGTERLETMDGTFSRNSAGDLIWNSFTGSVPSFENFTFITAPYGETTSQITIIPATNALESDAFVCAKNIVSLRVFTQIQTSSNSTSRWRTQLFLNGAFAYASWGAPPNNVTNQRTFGALEYGPIAAGTEISIRVNHLNLPTSTQNQRTYFVIEYEY